MQAGKPSVRVVLGIDRDVDPCGTELLDHRVEIPHAKIDHPLLPGIAEMFTVLRKRGKDGRARLLRPGLLAVVGGHEIDAEMFLVPLSRRRRILCAEEQASDSSYTVHAELWLTVLLDLVNPGSALRAVLLRAHGDSVPGHR